MATPYTITALEAVGIGATVNLIQGKKGRVLAAVSLIEFFLNRQDTDVRMDILVGDKNVGENISVQLQAAAGIMPSLRDDLFIRTFGGIGDELILNATNNDAAAQEARAVIRVTEIDDMQLMQFLGIPMAGVA